MKSLVQVNTVYQLFIMINLRLHHIPDGIVDIALSDHTPVLKEYILGLKDSGLFRNVYYMESLKFNNRFWKTENNNKAALYNHAKKSIEQTLEESKIFYPQYDYLYIANLDAYTKFLHKVFPDLKIIQFEDGAATCSTDWKTISSGWDYIKGFNSIYDAVEGLYLYSPQFLKYKVPGKVLQLPQIKKDLKTTEIYNEVFNYKPIGFPRYIFIEQSFEVDGIVNNDLDFMKETFDVVGYDNLYIKPHPRNRIHRPFAYGLSKMLDDKVPFELMFLNDPNENSVYITVDSGALISTRVIFNSDVKTIFLYKAITGKTHNHGGDSFSQYMDRFSEYYHSKNLIIPGSLKEYSDILKHL